MAAAYEDTFNYVDFQQTMGITEISEPAYGLILRSVVAYLNNLYGIEIDSNYKVPYDLKYAIYRHAQYLYETQDLKSDILQAAAEGGGNRAVFSPKLPSDIKLIYKFYSPNLKIVLVNEDTLSS